MKKILALIFCLCIIFSSAGLAESTSPPLANATSQAPSFDPFTKLGNWIKKLFRRSPDVIICFNANVDNLTLSRMEIIADCPANNNSCINDSKEITVFTEASDHENDTLLYVYEVSGGKIVGKGPKVIWNLSGVNPGTYTITAGVDEGAGLVGKTGTLTIRVVECPDCK